MKLLWWFYSFISSYNLLVAIKENSSRNNSNFKENILTHVTKMFWNSFSTSRKNLLWQFKCCDQNPFLSLVLNFASFVLAPFLAIFCPCGPTPACSACQDSLLSHLCHIEENKKASIPEILETIIPQFLGHICNICPELIRERGVVIALSQAGFPSMP